MCCALGMCSSSSWVAGTLVHQSSQLVDRFCYPRYHVEGSGHKCAVHSKPYKCGCLIASSGSLAAELRW